MKIWVNQQHKSDPVTLRCVTHVQTPPSVTRVTLDQKKLVSCSIAGRERENSQRSRPAKSVFFIKNHTNPKAKLEITDNPWLSVQFSPQKVYLFTTSVTF